MYGYATTNQSTTGRWTAASISVFESASHG